MLARLEGSFAREREFTLHASHELRTPLTIMRGQIETALREGGLAPDQHELLASQLGEIERLAAIVDGLFLLAKADAGLVEMKREPVALHQLVEDVFEDARMLGGAAKIEVSLDTMEPVAVNGDGRRLRQLLLALADNAIKFNRPGGAVRFRLARRGGEAELTISNTGDGIPAEVLPRVFDRFYRGDPARGSGADGSGLGLSIAQWIASAHGGTIQIASVPGGETTVAVRLPAG